MNKETYFYKVLDLFGNETLELLPQKGTKKKLFHDYGAFVEKFEVKKTTDDCYTPPEVMEAIVEYVNSKYPLNGKKIIRPFFPGGDYESIEYADDMVVIDNPPFSIIAKICRFYIANNIKFFLFCPHMTAFSSDIGATHIICSAGIVYTNGATIKTAFVSNLFGNARIIGDAELHKKLKEVQKLPRCPRKNR